MAESLLDKEFLSRLEYLYVVTQELYVGHVAADRLSKKFGVGLEFADYRPYNPGDDLRYIDWFAYARRGDLLIKLFAEEQAAQIYFVVDGSRSMSVGQPQKLFYAKKIAAALGYIALANLDPVTIVSFDVAMREGARMFEGRGQLQPMLRTLDAITADGHATDLGNTMRQFVQRYVGRRGLVVMISDFLDQAGYEETIRLLHYHRFDLLAIHVADRDEVEPGFSGDVELIDSESGHRTLVQMTPGLIATYKERRAAHYANLAHLCRALRRSYLEVVTDTPFETLIFEIFRRREFIK